MLSPNRLKIVVLGFSLLLCLSVFHNAFPSPQQILELDTKADQNLQISDETWYGVPNRTLTERSTGFSIVGDADFHAQAAANGWDLDGRNGSAAAPYRISGYNFSTSAFDSYQFYIVNTTVHFQITENYLYYGNYSVYLYNVSSFEISYNTIDYFVWGISINGSSSQGDIFNNFFTGFMIRSVVITKSSEISVLRNYHETGENSRIEVVNTEGITLESNILQYSEFAPAIFISNSSSFKTNHNSINGSLDASIRILFSINGEISNNILTNSGPLGQAVIFLGRSQQILVSNNHIENFANFVAIGILEVDDVTLSQNNVIQPSNKYLSPYTDLHQAIYVEASRTVSITDNYLEYLTFAGVYLVNCNDSIVSENQIFNVETAMILNGTANSFEFNLVFNATKAIQLIEMENSQFVGNQLFFIEQFGVSISSTSHGNEFIENTIANIAQNGILVYADALNNAFTNNNFVNMSSYGISDTDLALDGNFWDGWTSPDDNGDGIVDTPLVLDGTGGSTDVNPLVTPLEFDSLFRLRNFEINSPVNGEFVFGPFFINWTLPIHPLGYVPTYTIRGSYDGFTWFEIATDLISRSYELNSTEFDQSLLYLQILAQTSDGISRLSDTISIQFPPMQTTTIVSSLFSTIITNNTITSTEIYVSTFTANVSSTIETTNTVETTVDSTRIVNQTSYYSETATKETTVTSFVDITNTKSQVPLSIISIAFSLAISSLLYIAFRKQYYA